MRLQKSQHRKAIYEIKVSTQHFQFTSRESFNHTIFVRSLFVVVCVLEILLWWQTEGQVYHSETDEVCLECRVPERVWEDVSQKMGSFLPQILKILAEDSVVEKDNLWKLPV